MAEEAIDRQRPATMADIAKRLGISRQLVSIVLRDAPGASAETRQRVREAARELGYNPHAGARSLRRSRSRTLGVLFAPSHSTEPEIVAAIYPAAAERGYDVILSAHTKMRDPQEAIADLLGHRSAALILIGSTLSHEHLMQVARRSTVPVVDLGSGRAGGNYDVVRSAGDRGIADMVDHLVGVGHRDIAFVDAVSMPLATLRRRGYRSAMRRHGLTMDVVACPGDYTAPDYFEEAGYSGGRSLLERDTLPTAVVCSNDHTAVGVLQCLSRAGVRVPEDVSLTGFDDAPISRLSGIDLSTVRQDPLMMGKGAVDSALRRIMDAAAPPQETVIVTSLVVRGSVAPPPSAD